MVLVSGKRLSQNVCDHVLCGDVVDGDRAGGDLLSNEVVADVDVLTASVMLGILREGDAALTIGVDDGRSSELNT